MNAVCEALSVRTVAPRGGGIAIIADRPHEIARIERSLGRFGAGRPIVYRGALGEFEASGGEVVLLQAASQAGAARCAKIEALCRSCKLVLIGDSRLRDALSGVKSARAWAFVDCQNVSSNALNDAIASLERARASEDRLIRALCDQGAQLRRLAGAAALAHPAFARSRAALDDAAASRLDGEAASAAFDAADELQFLDGELGEALKSLERAQRLLVPVDLNQIVESFVRDNAAAGIANLSAQTGREPILVIPETDALRALLEAMLLVWRQTRHPHDKLELLTWDPGPQALLAIVLSHRCGSSGAAVRAPAFIVLRDICRTLHPLAEGCGAHVESAGHFGSAALTISLPKQPPAGAASAARRLEALPDALF
jgi:hypothetical protein